MMLVVCAMIVWMVAKMEIIRFGEESNVQSAINHSCSSDDCRDTRIACAGDGICPDLTP